MRNNQTASGSTPTVLLSLPITLIILLNLLLTIMHHFQIKRHIVGGSKQSPMPLLDAVLDTDITEGKAKSYRNGFTVALIATFVVLSYEYWVVGDLAIETLGVLFSTALTFVASQYLYDR